ncbi:MAG: L-rhamnose/proton symporter RhaT, partial [Acidobacteriaceae bacterium]
MTGIIAGIGWHMVGAASAASFYAPISKVKRWTWESTWAVAGIFSWVLLPICVSAILLPDMRAFYASIDSSVLLKAFLFGCMWGVGNVSYGLTMRYLGMSLGIGVAIGVTLVVGTLIPPLVHGQARELVATSGGLFTLLGIVLALGGIVIVSVAGHRKEIALGSEVREFDVRKGLLLAVLCGIFSSGMSFAIDAARPMQAQAVALGVNPLYSALPSYVIIMGGGGLVNFAYCFLRLGFKKELSLRNDLAQAGPTIGKNAALAATGGIMWYLQFFFYA